MISEDIEAESHAGIADRVFKVLHGEKEAIDKSTAAVLSRVQTKRDQSDYELEVNDNMEEFSEIEEQATEFIENIKKIVENNGLS